jgi:UPF0042 nucleotide-binding protein
MIEITSFGFGHDLPPEAHILADVRSLFRHPHLDPVLRAMTGLDDTVITSVMAQPGARALAQDLAASARNLGQVTSVVRLAIGCIDGRHRSVVLVNTIAEQLAGDGVDVKVVHRDVDRAVLS